MAGPESDCECAQHAALLRLVLVLVMLRCPHVDPEEAIRSQLRESLDGALEEVSALIGEL
jgi:hypothetical protein